MSVQLVAGGALAVVAGLYFGVVPSSTKTLGGLLSATNADARAQAQQLFVFPETQVTALPTISGHSANTYYRILGPATGKRILLIHGIGGSWANFPRVLECLVTKGFQLLVFDIYGRGCSDAPPGSYNAPFFVQQAVALMDHVGWDRASVLGFSMGGAIAVNLADLHPERVDKLILIAPAGLMKSLPPNARLLATPIIGDILSQTVAKHVMLKENASDQEEYKKQPGMGHCVQSMKVGRINLMHNPGFYRSFVSTIRGGMLANQDLVFERVGDRFRNRVFCAWGTSDTVCPYGECVPAFRRCMPEATLVEIPGGKHSFMSEDPERVLAGLHAFMSS
ncbi:hypothetical protein HDU99_000211 [Rhizoclosmatium hyalinum]|nr:hypothetical protein HDU99_000211 [Rhizoclosmatium hyalinum]